MCVPQCVFFLSLSVCVSQSVCLSHCEGVFFLACVCLSLSLCVCLLMCVSLRVLLSLSQCLSLSPFFCVSLSVWVCSCSPCLCFSPSMCVCVCVCVCVCLGVHHLIQCHWVMMSLLWVWCSESIMVCWLFIFAITEFSSAVIRNISQVVVQDKIQVQGRLTAIFIGICGYAPKASMRE